MDTTATRPDLDARRTRLREFQANLVQRMHAASTGEGIRSNLLGLAVGESRWLVDLQEAGEIVPATGIVRVPLTREWFLGLANVRGNLLSVVDLGAFLGMPPTPIDKHSRIVGFAPALSVHCGLLVSSVLGLRDASGMEPAREGADAPWVVRRLVDRDAQSWTQLSFSALLQDRQFLQVGT